MYAPTLGPDLNVATDVGVEPRIIHLLETNDQIKSMLH